MLNVLIVEDLPSDAGLCEREVKKVLNPCTFLRVETRGDFLKALTDFKPELVLCDYKMPHFDGMTALKLALQHDPDLPFILVTGSVSEDVAVGCIKAGAWDYVIKEHIKRLGPAVLAALEEKKLRIEKRQSQHALRQSEERYRALFENAGQSIAVVKGGKIVFGNPKLEQITGYTISELAGMDTFKLIHPDDREMVLDYSLRRQREEPVPSQYQLRYFNKAGERRWLERRVTDISWEGEKASLLLDTDISELKEAEEKLRESEDQLRSSLESAPDGVYMNDFEGRLLYSNRRCDELVGYDHEEMVGKSFLELNSLSKEGIAKATELLQKNIQGKSTGPDEFELIRKDGRIIPVEINTSVIERLGQTIVLGFVRDITERKQAEEQIRILASLVDAADAVILVHDFEGHFLYANKTSYERHGYSKNEFLSLRLQQLTETESTELMPVYMKQIIENGHATFEVTHHRKDGTLFPLLVSAQTADWGGKKVVLSIATDLTERKKVETELHDSVKRFNQVAEIAEEFIWEVDENGVYIYCSPAVEKILGYSVDELVGRKHFYDLFSPEVRDELKEQALPAFKGKQPILNFVNPSIHKNGSRIYLETNSLPIIDKKGNLVGYRGVDRDITDRMLAEEALKKIEKSKAELLYKLDEAQHIAKVGSWERDLQTNSVWWSDETYFIFGVSRENYIPNFEANDRFIHPDDFEKYNKSFEHSLETGEPLNSDCRIITGDGILKYCNVAGKVFYDDLKKPLRFTGTIMDISDRKEKEEQIIRSKSLLQTVIDYTPDRIAIKDYQHRYLLVNMSLANFLNVQPQEMIGKLDADFFTHEEIRGIHDDDSLALAGQVIRKTRTFIGKNGNQEVFDAYRIPLKDLEDNIYGILIYNRDITEIHNAAENLKKSYEQVQKVLDETVAAIATICETRDPYTAGHQNRASQLACAIAREIGISEEAISYIKTGAVLHDIGKLYVPAEILSKPGKLTDIEYAIIKNHPQVGYDIVKNIDFPSVVAQVILQHHERLDGSGYPNHLTAGDISSEAKIMAVADVVEAMSSHRPYRPSLGIEKAIEEINRNKGTLYDEAIVDACTMLFNEKQFKFE